MQSTQVKTMPTRNDGKSEDLDKLLAGNKHEIHELTNSARLGQAKYWKATPTIRPDEL